jgi:hypothetical protein
MPKCLEYSRIKNGLCQEFVRTESFPCLCMELVGELENITIACSLLVVSVLLVELLIICKVLGSLIVKVC